MPIVQDAQGNLHFAPDNPDAINGDPTPPAGPSGGIGALFYALGRGGKQIRSDYAAQRQARQTEMDYKGGQAQKELEDAVIRQKQRIEYAKNQQTTRAMVAATMGPGHDPEADYMSNIGMMNESGPGNVSNAADAMQKVSDMMAAAHALQAGQQGNYREQNAQLASIARAPVAHVKVEGGQRYDPYDPGVTSELTDPGAAMVAAHRAAAGAHDATAAVARDRADIYRNGGGRSRGDRPATGDQAKLDWARKLISDGEDPKRVADYLVKKGYPSLAKQVYSPSASEETEVP